MRFAIFHRPSQSLQLTNASSKRSKRRQPGLVAGLVIATLGFFGAANPCSAQISRPEANRLGLEAAWQSQIQLPAAGRGLVSALLWADPAQMHQYAVVELPDRTIRISAEQLDRKGAPIGLAQAKSLANERALRLAPNAGNTLQVLEVNVPQINLVVVTTDGIVQCIDAETGMQMWSTACGRVGAPTHEAAVSSVGVTVVQGTDLFLLDWKKGVKLMTLPLRHGTSNAVSVCNDIAFVSNFGGQVEAYGLNRDLKPWSYQLFGHAVGHPVTSANHNFTAIATDKGYTYVLAGGESPDLWLRYEATAPISGSLATANNAFYIGSLSGVMAKLSLDSRLGTITWEYPTGKPVTEPALIANDTVYFATEAGDLVAVQDADGKEKWTLNSARVQRPISVANNQLICVTHSNQLISVDVNTGAIRGTTSTLPLAEPIVNAMNDRIYVATSSGNLQCLRPVGAELPTAHAPIVPTETATENGTAPTTTQPAAESANPFGGGFESDAGAGGDIFGGDDPFGGSTTDAGGDAGDSDPFGGGGGDPFGGDAGGDAGGDPFGTP